MYQVPLIQQARRMGIETLVVSVPGNYPGFAFGDKICYEDTRDYEKILEIARAENIDGIVTMNINGNCRPASSCSRRFMI
mgnify:CR=1 FL=1